MIEEQRLISLKHAARILGVDSHVSGDAFAKRHGVEVVARLGNSVLFRESAIMEAKARKQQPPARPMGLVPAGTRGGQLPINKSLRAMGRVEVKLDALILALTKQLGLQLDLSRLADLDSARDNGDGGIGH